MTCGFSYAFFSSRESGCVVFVSSIERWRLSLSFMDQFSESVRCYKSASGGSIGPRRPAVKAEIGMKLPKKTCSVGESAPQLAA